MYTFVAPANFFSLVHTPCILPSSLAPSNSSVTARTTTTTTKTTWVSPCFESKIPASPFLKTTTTITRIPGHRTVAPSPSPARPQPSSSTPYTHMPTGSPRADMEESQSQTKSPSHNHSPDDQHWRKQGVNTWTWRGHKIAYSVVQPEPHKTDDQQQQKFEDSFQVTNNGDAPLLLIHGFGASLEHWRYNVRPLANQLGRSIYAIDLLGFGRSEKPTHPAGFRYGWGGDNILSSQIPEHREEKSSEWKMGAGGGGEIWACQILDFIQEVIPEKKAILVGNSLGGYSAMYATAKDVIRARLRKQAATKAEDSSSSTTPEGQSFADDQTYRVIKGLVLVNSAGPILSSEEVLAESQADRSQQNDRKDPSFFDYTADAARRIASFFGFLYLRRKQRIRQVLEVVYSNKKDNVDDDLIDFIQQASFDKNAFEVFYRTTVARNSPFARIEVVKNTEEYQDDDKDNNIRKGKVSVNSLMHVIEASTVPVTLLWGKNDPWITMKTADKIQELLPRVDKIFLDAGHCPHDEVPEEFNAALVEYITSKSL